MPDREKAIKGFECCHGGRCNDCPYFISETCANDLNTDVLELLKQQEAVEPEVEVMNEIDCLYRCPKCHKYFFYEKQKYCDQCGKAVKWDARP